MLLFVQIRSYCKTLTAIRTNRIVMHRHVLLASLCCCFIDTYLCITIRFVQQIIKLFAIRSDLSRQRYTKQQRSEASNTCRCITIQSVLSAIKLFAIRSNLSKQRCAKQQRNEASNTCPCITIRFVVLLAVSVLQYDLICPDSNILHIGALKQLARAYMRYNAICPAAYNNFSL